MNDMEYTDKEYCLEVWGDWACFTRPELKVERVSYDVITPSAARAIFEAILFKRYAMRWQITKIEVLRPIKWATIRRNEVGAVASKSPIIIEDKRQQKNTLLLLDVRYRIYAKLVFIPVKDRPKEAFAKHQPSADENPMKYYQMFERRASQGQCFTQPYLGCPSSCDLYLSLHCQKPKVHKGTIGACPESCRKSATVASTFPP